MSKSIPVWFFLLCLLVGALFTMFFGWAVRNELLDHRRGGVFGDLAVEISSYPSLVKNVFSDLASENDEAVRVPRYKVDLSRFRPVKTKPGIDLNGVMVRADRDGIARAAGWRIIVGVFIIDGKLRNAAIALSPTLEVEKIWVLTENAVSDSSPRAPNRKFLHGFAILKDGSVIFSYDGGVSLQRFDRCGSPMWADVGEFNHSVTLDAKEKSAWVVGHDEVVKVRTATGKITQRISMEDLIAANRTVNILAIRTRDDNDLAHNSRNTQPNWLGQRFHLNDVDPLPAALADKFVNFNAGDLLISARSLNLLFVVDPRTLKIKWWRIGATRRQHDPDWGRNGGITVFDNRMGRDYSRIVRIDPKSYRTDVLLDGRKYNFYSRIRGKHQITAKGNLLVTSAQQGRVFEVAPNGDVVLEIVDTKPGSNKFNYTLSEAIWLPPDAFNFGDDKICEN